MTATIVNILVGVQHGADLKTVEIAGAFDPIRNAEGARAVGRAIGDQVADCLERRLRFGEDLSKGRAA